MKIMNREGKRKRELRNLIKRGRIWYWKKMVKGGVKFISLETDDLELAKGKRNTKENEATNKELSMISGARSTAGTLEQIFEKYETIGGITQKAIGGNQSMLMQVVRVGLGKESLAPADVKLDVLTPKLVRDYQDTMRMRYEKDLTNEKEKRMARDRADRTSHSTFNQAKSVFCKRRSLIERYREAGIGVPECVLQFQSTHALGSMTSKVYFPASDEVVKATFAAADALRPSDPPAFFLFWVALATGARRGEVVDMQVTDFIERDGNLWVSAGLGKDGHQMQIPVVNWPVHATCAVRPVDIVKELLQTRKDAKVKNLFDGSRHKRYDELGDRLNAWLSALGWNDEKKMHALRAYIGGKLFARNPRLAQLYLRHKSLVTTENFYSHFIKLSEVFTFEPTIVQMSEPKAA